MTYLSSRESLENVCQMHPEKPLESGIQRIVGGAVSVGAGALAVGLSIGWENIPGYAEKKGSILFVTIPLALGLGGFGLFVIGNGLYGLMERRANNSSESDGFVYYMNGGFTNRILKRDGIRHRGDRVEPIESIGDLASIPKGYAFLNGFDITDTDFKSVPNSTDSVSWSTRIHGEFNGNPTIITADDAGNRAKEFLEKARGQAVYLLVSKGLDSTGKGTNIEMAGPAL